MSAKAFDALSKSADVSSAPQTAQSQEQNDNNDKQKIVAARKNLIRFGSLAVLAFVVWLFATIAWFTMNRDVGTSGMSMSVAGPTFEVTNISGSRDGIFKDIHDKVHEEGALYWKMTATNNLINYNPYVDEDHPGDQGIHPGTEGVISFNVIPKTDSVTLDFDFEIIGYQASTDDKGTEKTDDDELVMTALSDVADGDGIIAQNMLNGHILLFEHRDEVTVNGVTTVTYSTPICSTADMHRIMNRTVTGKNTATLIDIYWVWPSTLSHIVNASASGITTTPFCVDDDAYDYDSYTAISGNVATYPHYYLKGATSTDTITVSDIGAHYSAYGDMYDQGDNEIGMRVNYLLLKLSVTERTAGGGGS